MQLGEMQNEISCFFTSLGVSHVQVEVCDDRSTVAKAGGFYLYRTFPRLDLCINWAWGKICMNLELANNILSFEEQRFLLSHESTHIFLNHVPTKLPVKIFNELLKQLAPEVSIAVDVLKLLLHGRGIPPPISALTKEHELEADIQAILFTRNKTAAISCLTKLVNGNLESISHEWEALGVKMPVMTMRERIEEIEQRINDISRYYSLTFL